MDGTDKAQRVNEPSVIERGEHGSENSSEKHQIVEEESPHQAVALHVPGENDQVTWKTWCVIVVCSFLYNCALVAARWLIKTVRYCRRPLDSLSGPFQQPQPCRTRSLPNWATLLLSTGSCQPTQSALPSDSCSLGPTVICSVADCASSWEKSGSSSEWQSLPVQSQQSNSRPAWGSQASLVASARCPCVQFRE